MAYSRGRGNGSVLLVANYPSDVGYAWWLMERYWAAISKWARDMGRATTLAFPAVRSIAPALASAPIDIVEADCAHNTLRGLIGLMRLVRARRIRSVYLTDWPYLSLRYAVLRMMGVKDIVVHDHTPGDRQAVGGLRGAAKSLVHSFGIFSATRYIAVSPILRTRLIENGRCRSERCITVQNGIRPFDSKAYDRRWFVDALGVEQDAFLVAMASRATLYKGLDVLIEVAARLNNAGETGIKFIHCGDGPDAERFHSAIKEKGLARQVFLLGHRDDVGRILQGCDAAFHPSRGEAHCLAVLEYMQAGLPVVVPDTPTVSQDVIDGETGVIYPAESVDAASKALSDLARERASLRRMSAKARARVARDFMIDQAERRLIAALEGHL